MNIVFFCQSCGARFEVPPTSAGKKGRCKKCGQISPIPQAEQLASMVAIPALAPASVLSQGGPRSGDGAFRSKDSLAWLATAPSNVGLAPLTSENLAPIHRARRPTRPKIDDDLGDSKPYLLAEPLRPASLRPSGGRPASGLTMLWRRDLGFVQKFFRWLNETAYLLSVPFLMIVLFGAVVRSRPLALLGATVVVLLNLGRIVTGVANVVVIPFRDGPFQGILFLIPPMTFVYLANHWSKLKKPTMRIVTPALTIAAVFLAFTFVPSLRKPGAATPLESVKALEDEMIGEAKKIKSVDVDSLGGEAAKKVREAAKQINAVGQ